MSKPAYERIGRVADGWFPQLPPGPRLDEAKAIVAEAARAAGRNPDEIAVEGRVAIAAGSGAAGVDKLLDHIGRWRAAGASHVSINTMGARLGSVDEHVALLTEVARAIHSPA